MSVITLHSTVTSRVLRHEGRQQPYTLWVRANDAWVVERFYEDGGDALAHAVRFDGGAG